MREWVEVEGLDVFDNSVSYVCYVFFCAHEFECIEQRDVVHAGDDGADGCVVNAEIGVSASDDGFDVFSIGFVIEKCCHLFWYMRCFLAVKTGPAAVGGGDENVGVVHGKSRVFQGDSMVWEPEFLYKSVSVFGC